MFDACMALLSTYGILICVGLLVWEWQRKNNTQEKGKGYEQEKNK